MKETCPVPAVCRPEPPQPSPPQPGLQHPGSPPPGSPNPGVSISWGPTSRVSSSPGSAPRVSVPWALTSQVSQTLSITPPTPQISVSQTSDVPRGSDILRLQNSGSPQPSLLHPRSPQPHTPGLTTSSLHVPNLPGPHTPQKQAAPPPGHRGDPQKVGTVPTPIPNPCWGLPAPLCPLLSPRGDASGGWGGLHAQPWPQLRAWCHAEGGPRSPCPPPCPCLSAGA